MNLQLMKRTIYFIGSAGIPARYGGFETLAEQLSAQLTQDFNITVVCSGKKYKKQEQTKDWNGVSRIFIPIKANGVQSIFYDLISLIISFIHSDTICVLGGSAGLFLPIFKLLAPKKTIVFHPDGKEWTRNKWNSIGKLYLYLSIKAACRAVNYIIIDNYELTPLFNRFKSKLVYCTYGGNQYSLKKTEHTFNDSYWLTIARAEPENNLNIIAEAFTEMPHEKWFLISNFNNTKFGKQLYKKYSKFENIVFIPSIYSETEISSYYSQCKGYIHGHSAGGTNPTLVTAMWLNKPLICHNNIFNRETTRNLALFFNNSCDLIEYLNTTLEGLSIYKKEALNLAKKEYTWKIISEKYSEIFRH